VPRENCCKCLRTGLTLSEMTASDTFLVPGSPEILTFRLHHG
jgi:hypothetical protein